MMQQLSKSTITNKITVLISVIALTLVGWLAGHILRFTISPFGHPPIEQITPQIQNGFQPEGIQREVVLMGMNLFTSEGSVIPGGFVFESCVGNTYYTSLPAKCRSTDGRLVQVEEDIPHIILMPEDK